MQNKTFTLGLALTLLFSCSVCGSIDAQSRLKKDEPKAKVQLPKMAAKFQNNAPASFKAGLPKKAEGKTSDILIEEDFSGFTKGTPGNPDMDNMLACFYDDPGPYIDDSYMQQPGWSGSFVYQSGGKCSLVPPSLNVLACICTPLGDYSGEVTVTLKARALPSDGTGTSLNITAFKGGLNYGTYADSDDKTGYDTRLYVNQGWAEITYTFNNYSADNDGFICFSVSGAAEIDDIKITTTPTFIAAPKVLDATDFQKDGFTINWEPVRKSYNYYIDLYKKVYLSDEDKVYTADFEGSDALAAPFSYVLGDESGVEESMGADDSKGLVMHNGDTLTTPTSELSKYRDLKFYIKSVYPDDISEYDMDGYLYIDLLTESGWKQYGAFYAYMLTEGETISLDEDMYGEFSNQYLGVRFRPKSLVDGAYLVMDNLEATVSPECRLDTVDGDFPGVYYAQAKYDKTSFTFTGLEEEGEYYYTIKSHYVNLFSTPVLYEAFGVSTPEVKPATDIDARGSYTANFEPAPKATSYVVTNYGVRTAEQDGEFLVMDEQFSKVTSDLTTSTDPYTPTPLTNYETCSLDEYTDVPGWTGVCNSLSEGCLGAQEAYFFSSVITTPKLYLLNNSEFTLGLKAYGTIGSYLTLKIDDRTMNIEFLDSGDGEFGVMEGEVTLLETGSDLRISFYTNDYTPFMLDYVTIKQDLKKGDRVYTWLSEQSVDGESTSCGFSSLSDYGYDVFAYDVKAVLERDGKTAYSDPSGKMLVDLANGKSVSSVNGVQDADAVKAVAFYSINGTKLASPQHGVNLVKLSDGRVVKQFVK